MNTPELSSLLDAFQSSLRIKSRNLFLEYHKSPIPPSETIVPSLIVNLPGPHICQPSREVPSKRT
jgi:hypothetical protein